MKPLTANLKTLYQLRFIWLFHIVLISGVLIMSAAIYKLGTTDPPYIVIPLLIFFVYGVIIAFLLADISSKPFAFCLPNQIRTTQKMPLFIWLSMMTIISLLIVVLSFMGIRIGYAHFLGSIGLMSLSYWLGFTIIMPKRRGLIAFLFFFLLLFIIVFSIISEIKFIESILVAHPWISIFLSSIIVYWVYRDLGRKQYSRRLCIISWPGFSTFGMKKHHRFKPEYMPMNRNQRYDRLAKLIGSFFPKRISSNQNSLLFAHLYGQIYLIIGPFITYWKLILGQCVIFFLIFSVFASLDSGPHMDLFLFHMIIFIFAGLFCSVIFEHHRYYLFSLIERRKHFCRGIVFLITVLLIVLAFMALSLLSFNIISDYIPPNIFGNKSLVPPIEWILLVVPVIIVPLFGGLVILLRKTVLIISMVIMFFIAIAASFYVVNVMEHASSIIDPIIVLSAAAITWGFHLTVLYYDSMKRSLC